MPDQEQVGFIRRAEVILGMYTRRKLTRINSITASDLFPETKVRRIQEILDEEY